MEFLPGGDLNLKSKLKCLSSLDRVKFYFAEVLLAIGKFESNIGIEELHKHGIVYRDLKLDNIMISSDGHVKVTI